MKKTLAAIAAGILGIGAAAVAGAAPAAAADPKCTDATQHNVNPNELSTDSWYMTCIPQYGMGKAEFSVTTGSADPFPSGYSLTDGHQAITSSPSSKQTKSYFGALWSSFHSVTPVYSGAFMNLHKLSGTSTLQQYGTDPAYDIDPTEAPVTVAYPILAAGKATGGLPADCAPTSDPTAAYDGEYVVDYGPTTTTFTQTINNVIHKVVVKYTPAPLYIGLNFSGDPGDIDLDGTRPICVSSGGLTIFSASEDSDDLDWIDAAIGATNFAPGMTTLNPAVPINTDDPVAAVATDLGSFGATSTPVLATTGVDTTPTSMLGGGLLSAGVLVTALAVVRRRRSRLFAR